MKSDLRSLPLLFLLWLFSTPLAAEDLLGEISLLARGGTPHLALQLMEKHQPLATVNPHAWMRWERERIYVLQARQDWQGVVGRLSALPPGLPVAFRRWAASVVAEARIRLGQGKEARADLAGLIWGSTVADEALRHWRRLVIRSYLEDGRVGDAHTAMLRYQLDYGDGGEEWRLLRARVLLRARRPADAAGLALGGQSAEARIISVLARSRSGVLSAEDAFDELQSLTHDDALDAALRYELWSALAEAADRASAIGRELPALEKAVSLMRRAPLSRRLVELDAESLWLAYERTALELANGAQLLVGSYAPWFKLAEALSATEPHKARALYAYLAGRAYAAGERNLAHQHLAGLLAGEEWHLEVLRQLYLESGRYPDLSQVPQVVRYALVDQAIGESDIALASELISGLNQAPPGVDGLEWATRRARVLILGDHPAEGVAVLEDLLTGAQVLDKDTVDRINQVLFDLQTIGENEAAFGLFARLGLKVVDEQTRREVLFWMADSRSAQQRHLEAARLYLKSAMLPAPHSMDPWAQTARYQAAEALTEAGLKEDAREVYEGLLRVTREPARKAVLRRAIQQLWLKQDAPAL